MFFISLVSLIFKSFKVSGLGPVLLPVNNTDPNPDTLNDLKIKLTNEMKEIRQKYNSYAKIIRESLEGKKITAKEFSSYLLEQSAFDHDQDEQKEILLSTHQADIENAADLKSIFKLLGKRFASFLNYEIFEFIVDDYELDDGNEAFKYPQHLKTYINNLKISEFISVNPQLGNIHDSNFFQLKIDIDLTTRLSKLFEIKLHIAKILGVKSATIQLVDIERGCIEATFKIPTTVAKIVFKSLTDKQVEQLQGLQILWLRCKDYEFDFTVKDEEDNM